MLIVALPAELPDKFHHAQLYIGKQRDLFILVGFQAQVPNQAILIFAHKVSRCSMQPLPHRSKTGVAHSMSRSPGLRLCGAGLIGGRPHLATVSDVCIKSAAVRWQMKKAIMIDPPNLRRFIKSHSPSAMRDHRVKNPVGQIVHPGSWRVILVKMNFLLFVVKTIHSYSSGYFINRRTASAAALPKAAWPFLSKCKPSHSLGAATCAASRKAQP